MAFFLIESNLRRRHDLASAFAILIQLDLQKSEWIIYRLPTSIELGKGHLLCSDNPNYRIGPILAFSREGDGYRLVGLV